MPTQLLSQDIDTSTLNVGWNDANESWTYASATTITVPTDATTKYSVGDKIRLKQGAGYLYFYVVGVTATVLTITGGSDYTLANAGITVPAFSKVSSPVGFPQWFNFTPTVTGYALPPTYTTRFKIEGRLVTYVAIHTSNAPSNATTFTVTVPITAATNAGIANWGGFMWNGMDNGVQITPTGRTFIGSNTNVVTMNKDMAGNGWTAAGAKWADFTITYEI